MYVCACSGGMCLPGTVTSVPHYLPPPPALHTQLLPRPLCRQSYSSCPEATVVQEGFSIMASDPGGSIATAWCLDVAPGEMLHSNAANGVGFDSTQVRMYTYTRGAA